MIHLPDPTVEFISKLIKTTLKFWKGHWKYENINILQAGPQLFVKANFKTLRDGIKRRTKKKPARLDR